MYKWLTNQKYRFFAAKLKGVEKAIWEQDFKIAKARQLRENIRQDRDRALEAMANVVTNIKNEKDKAALKELNTQKDALDQNAKRYEAQMRMVDEQISGIPAKGEEPGQDGIMDMMKTLAELKGMYKDYLRNL